MRIIKGKQETLEKEAAELIHETALELLEKKENIVIGVVGGRSVAKIYEALNLPWEKVHCFLIDERLVSLDDEESNYKLAKISFPKATIHPYYTGDEENDNKKYTQLLEEKGGFDILILSAGEDGHVGGLYPQLTILNNSKGFFTFHDSPKPPKDRMTASRYLLEQAQTAFLVFFGEGKKEAFKRFQDLNTSVEECPAKLVLSLDNYVFVTE